MRIAAAIGIVIACSLIWLTLGSRIVLWFDLIFPGPGTSKLAAGDVANMRIQPGYFIIGPRSWPLEGPGFTLDTTRCVLTSGGHTFPLVREPGDLISFSRDFSRLEWQTPFAISFIGGTVSKRHRYVYDRFRWTKKSGAVLEITWRDQQNYWPGPSGWQDSWNNRLVRLTIRAITEKPFTQRR